MSFVLTLLILCSLVFWAVGLKQTYAGHPQLSLWSAGAIFVLSALTGVVAALLPRSEFDGMYLAFLMLFGAGGAAVGVICAIIAGVVYGAHPTKPSGPFKE